MRDLPVRRKMRLEGYDYSQEGCYFVTVCIKNKNELLGEIVVGANCVRPALFEIGSIVEREVHSIPNIYECIAIDNYIIMPNHIHMIIRNKCDGDGRTQFAPTISRVIKQFKGAITKRIGYAIWQKSFHDHVIRNEDEYLKIWKYIDENPENWAEDRYYTKEHCDDRVYIEP